MIPPKYWSPTRKLMLLGAMAGGKLVEATALGNPLTFFTDVSKPLKSLLIPFTPVQSGTGDPSPENIRSILPWDGLKVFGSGQNIITNGFTNGVLDLNTGAKSTNPNYITSEYIPVVPLKSYYFKCPTVVSSELDICYYDKDKHYIGYADADGYVSCNTPGRSRKTPAGCYYVRIDARSAQYNNDICINYPASVTGYVPAVGITETDISFPSPVYGGEHEAVSGKLMANWIPFIFDDQTVFNAGVYDTTRDLIGAQINELPSTSQDVWVNAYCDKLVRRTNANEEYSFVIAGNGRKYCQIFCGRLSDHPEITTKDEAKAFVSNWLQNNPVTIVYSIPTPTEQTLTGHQITALVGDNTIWSDADGSMTAVYLKKG